MRNEHTEAERGLSARAGTCPYQMAIAGNGRQATMPFCPHVCNFNPLATTEIQKYSQGESVIPHNIRKGRRELSMCETQEHT